LQGDGRATLPDGRPDGPFGAFASPERLLLFDLNDFDETLPGPWEWDVKRLAASVAVAGCENGFEAKRRTAIVRELVGEYRQTIRRFATMKNTGCVVRASKGQRPTGAGALTGERTPEQAAREDGRQGAAQGQRSGVREACRVGERRAADPGGPLR